MREGLLLPASILAGAALIAVGLFAGLRGRGPARGDGVSSEPASSAPDTPRAADPVPVPSFAGGAASGAVVRSGVPSTPFAVAAARAQAVQPAEAQQGVVAEVQPKLEALRKRFVQECWAPAVKRSPGPSKVTVTFTLAFDGTGTQVGRGVSDSGDPATARSDVTGCLRTITAPITIPPRPGGATVDVPFTLP